MNTFLVLLDSGHGGIVNGQYTTPGKRSPLFEDGKQLFEGVYNRLIVKLIHDKLNKLGLNNLLIVNVSAGDLDTPLGQRVNFANKTWGDMGRPPAIYISVHGDAAGNGIDWHPASGISVYTSKGQTKSDVFASLLIDKLDDIVTGVKWRKDETDGDTDKEENFYVLKETLMPAVLSENGFMTNYSECQRMLTLEWQNNIADAHVNAIVAYRKLMLNL